MKFQSVLCLCILLHLSKGQNRKLLLLGGDQPFDNEEVFGRFVNISGGRGIAKIGVITAASPDPEPVGDIYLQHFLDYGAAETYWVPVHLENLGAALDPLVVQRVNEMTGFYFSGGLQTRIVRSFYLEGDNGTRIETPVLEAIRLRYESGAAAAGGTSAGAACMPIPVMVTGGVSYDALKFGAQTCSPHPNELVYDPQGGIGFLPGFTVDPHFSERGKEGRLIRLVADTMSMPKGTDYGIGIDENTGLLITSDTDGLQPFGEVIGAAGVYFADLKSATINPNVNGYWSISSVHAHYLRRGDVINLGTMEEFRYASYKSDLTGQEAYDDAPPAFDIFAGNTLDPEAPAVATQLATRLINSRANSTTGITREDNPVFELTFIKGQSTKGFGGISPVSGAFDISYQDLIVNIMALPSSLKTKLD